MEKNKENGLKEETKEEKAIKKDKEATEQLLKKEEAKDKQIEQDYLEQLQRLQAEFENYRRRVDKEKQEIAKYAKEELVVKLLEVMDNFERATEAMEKTESLEDFKTGVRMIFTQLHKVLEEEGLKAISSVDEPFNPHEHEAIGKEDSDKDENIVIKELQRGYMLKDKVIRPSRVIVSGGKK
ncbi:MAG: nucleotide exchange factor GrpE [Candidatus Woesearchaeota archaeon]